MHRFLLLYAMYLNETKQSTMDTRMVKGTKKKRFSFEYLMNGNGSMAQSMQKYGESQWSALKSMLITLQYRFTQACIVIMNRAAKRKGNFGQRVH